MVTAVYRDLPEKPLDVALAEGRVDPEFFSWYFCRRKLHGGQADYILNANAEINCLPTSNRWGKTSLLCIRHYHKCFFKLDAEDLYNINGQVDPERYLQTKYFTVHTAGLWETAGLVWQDALKMEGESQRLSMWIKETPRTLPPKIVFLNGAEWRFRTLGDNGEGIDGHSFYLVTIDEAGWIKNLENIIEGVARLRVADVQGQIDLVGTMKVGISRPFYRYCNKAAVSTGAKIGFDHSDGRSYDKEFEESIQQALEVRGGR